MGFVVDDCGTVHFDGFMNCYTIQHPKLLFLLLLLIIISSSSSSSSSPPPPSSFRTIDLEHVQLLTEDSPISSWSCGFNLQESAVQKKKHPEVPSGDRTLPKKLPNVTWLLYRDYKKERRTPPALENTVKTMLWSNPHKIGSIYHERL